LKTDKIKVKGIVNKRDITRLRKLDQVFVRIEESYGTPPDWKRPAGFITLSRIILEQQVSLSSADAHYKKLSGYIKEFTPGNILKMSAEEFLLCQVSRQKASYLKALSAAIIDEELKLDQLQDLEESEVRWQLTAIKGIGNWTADVYLMFCLQAKDIFPVGDIAILNTAKELFHISSAEEAVALSEKWKPLRSLASYYLWHYYLSKRGRTG
jgi:DNA-3-methyladenine glycosylase II